MQVVHHRTTSMPPPEKLSVTFWFRLAVFYYLVPFLDPAETFYSNGYRNWIVYCQYNSIRA